MNLRLTALVLMLFVGCGEAPPETATPSPLIGADSDRLWILARASRVGDGRDCADRYLQRDDPRFAGLSEKCDRWSRHYTEYLRLNGFATVEYLHLQDPAYWRWFVAMRQNIADCVAAVGTLSLTANGDERADHARRRHACSPYDDAVHNRDQTTVDLGIRFD